MKGLLAKAEKMGRNGDSLLAHINPQEAQMLSLMGGSGSTNPRTGLLEFWTGEGDSDGGGTGESDDGVGGVNPSNNDNVAGVAPTAVAPSISDQINSLLSPNMNPAQIAIQAVPSLLGMSPQGLSIAANAIGQGIAAVTGATAQGAVQGQQAVGTGGVNGAAMDGSGSSAPAGPATSIAATPPRPPAPPPPPGLLSVPGGKPWNIPLQYQPPRGLLG